MSIVALLITKQVMKNYDTLYNTKDNYKKRKDKTTWLLLSPSVLFHCFLDWLEQQAGEMWESLAVDTPLE